MREIGHFIDGRRVAGTTGRHGDVFDPNAGRVQAHVAFALYSIFRVGLVNLKDRYTGAPVLRVFASGSRVPGFKGS